MGLRKKEGRRGKERKKERRRGVWAGDDDNDVWTKTTKLSQKITTTLKKLSRQARGGFAGTEWAVGESNKESVNEWTTTTGVCW